MQQYLSSLPLTIFSLCTWLAILSIVFIPLERLCARQKQPVFRKEFFIDLGYYFLNSLLPKLLLIIPLSIVAAVVHRLQPNGIYTWVATLSLEVRLVLSIIVGEVGAYWGHRWSHEVPWLWRFHAIHHSSEAMDWLVNTRAHPLDTFFVRVTGLVPIYLLGLAQPTAQSADIVPLLYMAIGTVWSFWVHANMNWRFGFVERLLATPAFHHWHHTNDGAEYINKNYAAILPMIDILFGSFYLPKHRWPQKYGIEMPIEQSFTGQLLQPLKW